jgi:hypothetical protein
MVFVLARNVEVPKLFVASANDLKGLAGVDEGSSRVENETCARVAAHKRRAASRVNQVRRGREKRGRRQD